MLKKLVVAIIVLISVSINLVHGIVGGHIASPPPEDDPVVFVRLFSRDARIEGIHNNKTGIYQFLGLRYAEPPINANRFLRTEYKRLVGDIDATKFGPPCPQPDATDSTKTIGNEDCLLLNVYTSQMPDETTGLPVIVWIHGGGFRYGSAAQYNPTPLTMKRVIVVPIQYRLGTLGILGEGNRDFAGNVALFDMVAALRWVKDYISYFGGNPENIKVMGHGSGATSAMHLSMSDLSSEYITGVIAMSGSVLTKFSLDEKPVQSTSEIAKINSCSTANETETVHCLRERSAIEIVENDSKVQDNRLAKENIVKMMTGFVGTAPNIEVPNDLRGLPGFIVTNPIETLANGTFKKIPLLSGVTKDETANGVLPDEIKTIFKTFDNFLGKLTPFIGLQDLKVNELVDSLTGGLTKTLSVPKLNDFLKIPEGTPLNDVITKLVKTTTDIFFNLPIFLTVQQWNKNAPSYLYSFEYDKGQKAGKQLLSGLPLVDKKNNNKLVGHGDELGFLFDVADVFGTPLNNSNVNIKSNQDMKVQDSFTNLIAEFARNVNTTESKPQSGIFNEVTSKSDNAFIKISDRVSVENDFHFCELATLGLPLVSSLIKSCDDLLLPVNQIIDVLTLNKPLVDEGLLRNVYVVQPPIPKAPPKQGSLLGLGLF